MQCQYRTEEGQIEICPANKLVTRQEGIVGVRITNDLLNDVNEERRTMSKKTFADWNNFV